MSIELRPPLPSEAKKLAQLGRETFIETFGTLYQPQDLETFLVAQYNPEIIAAELADGTLEYRVLARREEWLGFIKLGPLHLPVAKPLPNAQEIRQLYLRQEFTGRRLGKKFMAWAFEHLRSQGGSSLYLSVFSENHGALRFYQQLGFQKCGEYLYPVGNQRDLEFIMFQSWQDIRKKSICGF